MLSYYLRLASRSIVRSRITSAVVIAALGIGIGIAMSFVVVLHMLQRDPLPEKSDRIFYVQLDNWAQDRAYPGRGDDTLPTQVNYQDGTALMRSDIPAARSLHYLTSAVVRPDGDGTRPFSATTRAANADFFGMFDAPFAAGTGWSRADDEARALVVVLSQRLSERLFGSVDAVGRTINLAERVFKVVGVLERWEPPMRHYDLTTNAFAMTEELFIPFETAVSMELATTGNMDGWKPADPDASLSLYQRVLRSETVWLQMYVELPTAESRARFQNLLENHIRAQKEAGRFRRPLKASLSTIPQLMQRWRIVPNVARVLRLVSLLFLALCILSVVGLLLSSFLIRAHEVGLRRALGASRLAIFAQYIVESALLGLGGGVLGMGVSFVILSWIHSIMPADTTLDFSITAEMYVVAFAMALLSGIAAGLYPAWRVCATPPAQHLKA